MHEMSLRATVRGRITLKTCGFRVESRPSPTFRKGQINRVSLAAAERLAIAAHRPTREVSEVHSVAEDFAKMERQS